MPITDHYAPHWDPFRKALPERVFEDENIIIASNFECGNGFRMHRLDNGRYAVHIEPEPGDHLFSGSGCYFCFAVLNKSNEPVDHIFEVVAADAAWIRGREEEFAAWEKAHPDEPPPASYAGRSRFAITRRGDDWKHVPEAQMMRGTDHHAIAFSYELPAASDENPVIYFSNYHWYPYTDMTAYLHQLAAVHPQLALRSLCRSVEDRDVWAVEIGNEAPDAPVIVCAATPQPNEMGHWACRAVLDFLLCGSPEAEAVLKKHRICLIPHPNPDGTVRGTIAADALDNFVYFCGKKTISSDPEAPVEQVALWKYMKEKTPWLFIEWHSNHWHYRPGHTIIRYAYDLLEDPALVHIWRDWDRRLDALPDTCPEQIEGMVVTDRDNGYTDSIGVGVATELGAIPVMLKVHDKFPIAKTLSFVVDSFLAATDAYREAGR